jgi:serine/threonine-protein kinase
MEGSCPFIVMEYVLGQTLHDLVRGFGPMRSGDALPLFFQVVDGIQHAHQQGVVHRDLKASNVMLSQLGVVKVLDFGIARRVGSVHLTRGAHGVGTPAWMAPEQVRGEEPDVRTDVYALGLLLYWLVTARLPFEAENDFALQRAHLEEEPRSPRSFAPDLAEDIEKVILRALAKGRAERFAHAADLRRELGETCEPPLVRPLSAEGVTEVAHRTLVLDTEDDVTWQTSEPARGGAAQEPGPTCVFAPVDEGAASAAEQAATPTIATEPPAPRAPRADLPSRTPRARWLAWAGLALLMLCTLAGIRALWPSRPESPPREPPTLRAEGSSARAPEPPSPSPVQSSAGPAPAEAPEAAPSRQPAAAPAAAPAARRPAPQRPKKEDGWVLRRR